MPRSWSGFIKPEVVMEMLLSRRKYIANLHEAQLVLEIVPQDPGPDGIRWEFTFLPAESTGIRATRLPDAGS